MVMAQYVEALLPLYLPGTLTYHLPPTITVGVGSRVLVPLGRKKIYTAIVVMIHDRAPQGYDVKDVIARVAPTDARVLITGSNGTGKELVAHAQRPQGGERDVYQPQSRV